jgi:hypothetical protein
MEGEVENYEVIITDVTRYGQTLYCVAGWDRNAGRMFRPEPPNSDPNTEASRFWSADYVGKDKVFWVGNVVRMSASRPPPTFPFPHATEDRVITPGSAFTVLNKLECPQIVQALAPGISPSLPVVFGGGLIQASSGTAYVPAGHIGSSLGAVEKTPSDVEVFENNKSKLRATIQDGGEEYDLGITADALITRWKASGLRALAADLKESKKVHIRVGLSRPFPVIPDKCFVQMNGLYFL